MLIALAVVVAAQLAFTYLPFLQRVFDTRPLSLAQGAAIIGLGAGLFLILEVEKSIVRRLQRGQSDRSTTRS